MGDVEMVGLVDGQRLARGDAGAHRAGAGARFRPFRAEIEPRLAQIVVEGRVAQELDGHALPVRQQQHVILFGHLPVEPLQAGAGDVHEVLRLLAMLAQPRLRDDDRLARLRRIKLVGFQAAPPGVHDNSVAARIAAPSDTLDFPDVIRKTHQVTGSEGRLP